MKCSRCGRDATFTTKDGERVCDRHYHAVYAVSPTILSTSTTADALGARAVAAASSLSAGGGGAQRRRGRLARLWDRVRRR